MPLCIADLILSRKFEQSKTFGLVTSASSNAVWTRDEDVSGTARRTGAGRAIVGANEEVLCWDVKKGELLARWGDADCKAQVTAITQSHADEDVFAVGYVQVLRRSIRPAHTNHCLFDPVVTKMEAFVSGTRE